MAKFKIEWLENKSPEWKIASLKPEEGEIITDVSINKVSKKGEAFPNFDNIALASEIDGELWTSDTGKKYLFPPKEKKAPMGYRPKPNIAEAQEVKRKNIEAAQDRAAWMWAKYGATELATHHATFKFMGKEELLNQIEEIATKIYNMEPLTPFN